MSLINPSFHSTSIPEQHKNMAIKEGNNLCRSYTSTHILIKRSHSHHRDIIIKWWCVRLSLVSQWTCLINASFQANIMRNMFASENDASFFGDKGLYWKFYITNTKMYGQTSNLLKYVFVCESHLISLLMLQHMNHHDDQISIVLKCWKIKIQQKYFF